jgi:hypothetical protein
MFRFEYWVDDRQDWDSICFWQEDYENAIRQYDEIVKLYPDMTLRLVEMRKVTLFQNGENV